MNEITPENAVAYVRANFNPDAKDIYTEILYALVARIEELEKLLGQRTAELQACAYDLHITRGGETELHNALEISHGRERVIQQQRDAVVMILASKLSLYWGPYAVADFVLEALAALGVDAKERASDKLTSRSIPDDMLDACTLPPGMKLNPGADVKEPIPSNE